MSSHQDPEKGIPREERSERENDQEREMGTRTESTAYQSDNSRNPSHKNDASPNASIAYPDSNHEEADQADMDDLARQKVPKHSWVARTIKLPTNSSFSFRQSPNLLKPDHLLVARVPSHNPMI